MTQNSKEKALSFTPEKVNVLRGLLANAKKDVVIFEGNEIDVTYGKYLVQYLEGVFRARSHDVR